MKKGYLILFAAIFGFMTILPLANLNARGKEGNSLLKSDRQEVSFKVLFADGSIKEIPANEYVFGVVAAEMSPECDEQALCAQAVAAYTFALRKKADRTACPPPELKGADISADYSVDQGFITREQAREKWGQSADGYEKKIDSVINGTSGITVKYNGEYALTLYHAVSAGRTESAEVVFGSEIPYLVPVQSVGDILSDRCCSEVRVNADSFLQKIRELSSDQTIGQSDDFIGQKTCSDSGTVISISLYGKELSGSDIRKAFSLRSANFDIQFDGDQNTVTFTVRGYGHLVGMSQNGAEIMAENGSDFREILLHYYPGCEISEG